MTTLPSSQVAAEPSSSESESPRATVVHATDSGSELRPITWASGLLAVFIFALWGGNAVAGRVTQDALPPIGTASLRFLLGTIMMASWAAWSGASFRVARHEWGPIIWVGFLTYVHIGLWHWGLGFTNSAHASVIVAAHPIVVAALAHYLLPGDRLSLLKAIGLAVATVGVAVMVFGNAPPPDGKTVRDAVTLFGDLVIVVSGVLLAVRIVATKFAMATVNAGKLTLWSNVVGTVLFFATTL
ncbi:MAG TPA: DMT family transporter, partial [Pirellulales bacterium]